MNEGVRLQPPPDPPIQLQPGAARRPPMSTARHIFRDIFPLHQKLDIPEPHQSFGAVADDSAKPYLTIRVTPADTTDFFIPQLLVGAFTERSCLIAATSGCEKRVLEFFV